jgi:DNA-binding NarL/FixJ family response regulator
VSAPVRVVLVEDNQIFRETIELLLGLQGGIEVVGSAETGDGAIELCGSLRPDVVVMDYRMPGLDGAEATAGVLGASPKSRVVCLTASVSREEVDRLFAAGAVACVTKDADFAAVVAAIREAAGEATAA